MPEWAAAPSVAKVDVLLRPSPDESPPFIPKQKMSTRTPKADGVVVVPQWSMPYAVLSEPAVWVLQRDADLIE